MDTKETLRVDGPVQGPEYHLFETNQMEQEKMEKIENPQGSETDKYNENISRLTFLIDMPLVKSLRLANINRQLQDLITECKAISKLTNDTVLKHQPMTNFTDRQIHPNSKLETQLKSRKFHKTKKLRSKRKTASFNTFEEKETFVKKITSNKAMQKSGLQAPAMKKQKFPDNDSSLTRKIIKKFFSSDGKFKSIKKPTNECIPRIKGLTDCRLTLLRLGGAISITYLPLFLLEVIFSSKEYTSLKQSAPGFRPGWLQDEVIAAYLYNLRKKHLNMEFIYPSEALALNKLKNLRNLLAQVD